MQEIWTASCQTVDVDVNVWSSRLICSTDHHREEKKKTACPAFPAPTPSCRPPFGPWDPRSSAGQSSPLTLTCLLTKPSSYVLYVQTYRRLFLTSTRLALHTSSLTPHAALPTRLGTQPCLPWACKGQDISGGRSS